MSLAGRALVLALAGLSAAALAQPTAPLIPDELVAEARAATDAVKALDPPSISRMSSEQALGILRRVRVAQLEITQALAQRLGEQMNEERFRSELAARGLGDILSEAVQQRARALEGKLSPQEKRALEHDLGERFPAYGNYIKRALVSGVILQLSRPRFDVNDRYQATRQIPASIDAGRLQALRAQRGVQSAAYGDGVFRVVLDDEILAGGTVELGATPKGDGTLEWRCTSSENVRQFMPATCRQ